MPTDKDLDERIDLNLTKDGFTLEQIMKYTDQLIISCIDQSNLLLFQIKIYQKLNDRINQRIKEGAKSNV